MLCRISSLNFKLETKQIRHNKTINIWWMHMYVCTSIVCTYVHMHIYVCIYWRLNNLNHFLFTLGKHWLYALKKKTKTFLLKIKKHFTKNYYYWPETKTNWLMAFNIKTTVVVLNASLAGHSFILCVVSIIIWMMISWWKEKTIYIYIQYIILCVYGIT